MISYEAKCTKCGETFNPHGPEDEDLIHLMRQDGELCDGQGVLTGFVKERGET